MTLLSLLGRIMRYFLLRPETPFLLCISLALWELLLPHGRGEDHRQIQPGRREDGEGGEAEIMAEHRLRGLDVLEAEFSKTLEFKSHNVAVFHPGSERPHGGPFRSSYGLSNKTHPHLRSDGHGGEVGIL